MIKGTDFIGITVSYYCHDGQGKYVMHFRNKKCRDEHERWDFGGGGVKFGETVEEALHREIKEEFGTTIVHAERIGVDEVFREHEEKKTHWIAFRFIVELNHDDVYNAEPEKHDKLEWFTLDNLPSPLHSQIPKELERYKEFLK